MEITLLDWIFLYCQIILLFFLIFRELARRTNRNLYIILIASSMLVLVQFQAWWTLEKFQNSNSNNIVHLFQNISIEGVKLANIYSFLCIISLFLAFQFFSKRQPVKNKPTREVCKSSSFVPNKYPFYAYASLSSWVILLSAILTILLGGLQNALDNPGSSIGGQTMLLIAISSGKIPLLRKIESSDRINIVDIALFCITFLITLFNTRLFASLIVVQLGLIFNYCRQQIPRKFIFAAIFIAIAIFIFFGLYRDNASANVGLNFSERIDILYNRFYQGETPLEWFYRGNVEGFVGLAGILTYEIQMGGITHDFGLSNIVLLTQLIPNYIRNNSDIIQHFSTFVESLYPYPNGSVLSPGLESAYAHFGLLGVIILGIFLGYVAKYLHARMLIKGKDRLKVALLSVQAINLIRTMLRNVFFFALGELFALFVYKLFITIGREANKNTQRKIQ
jgi:hypothetical protein